MKLSQGALYRHFPTKDAIWQAVMEWVSDRLLAKIDHTSKIFEEPVAALQAIFMTGKPPCHRSFPVANSNGSPLPTAWSTGRRSSSPMNRLRPSTVNGLWQLSDTMAAKFGTAIIVVTHDEKIIPTFKRICHIHDGVTYEEAREGRDFD